MVLHHIVTWKIRDFADGRSKEENIALLLSRYEELKKEIPSIRNAKLYRGTGKEGNDDVILLTEFESEEALKAYATHPKHLIYSAFCKSVRETRTAIDYWD